MVAVHRRQRPGAAAKWTETVIAGSSLGAGEAAMIAERHEVYSAALLHGWVDAGHGCVALGATPSAEASARRRGSRRLSRSDVSGHRAEVPARARRSPLACSRPDDAVADVWKPSASRSRRVDPSTPPTTTMARPRTQGWGPIPMPSPSPGEENRDEGHTLPATTTSDGRIGN
jgi:hypothetical protein